MNQAQKYEATMMALHDPRYGDQLAGHIKLHNHSVDGKTVELLDRYRYSMKEETIVKTGDCEVCNKPVRVYANERFCHQIEERAVSIDGDPTHWTNVDCHDLHGHKECLLTLRKPNQGVQS